MEKKEGEEFYPFEVFNKSIVMIYSFLVFINTRSGSNLPTTAVEIMERFGTGYKNTNRYIQKLIEPKLIKKRRRVNGYDSYLITEKGQKFIKFLSKRLNFDETLGSL